jgi:hypothetical protein
VTNPANADIALRHLKPPLTARSGAIESIIHAGSFEYSEDKNVRQAEIYETVRIVIVDMYVDRPAVIPEVMQRASALFYSCGSTTDSSSDVIFVVYRS